MKAKLKETGCWSSLCRTVCQLVSLSVMSHCLSTLICTHMYSPYLCYKGSKLAVQTEPSLSLPSTHIPILTFCTHIYSIFVGSKLAVQTEPKCYVDTGVCKVTWQPDTIRTNSLYGMISLVCSLLHYINHLIKTFLLSFFAFSFVLFSSLYVLFSLYFLFLSLYRHTVPAGLFTALVFVGITYELLNLFDASLNPILALILGKKNVHVCFCRTMTVNYHHHALSIVRHHTMLSWGQPCSRAEVTRAVIGYLNNTPLFQRLVLVFF